MWKHYSSPPWTRSETNVQGSFCATGWCFQMSLFILKNRFARWLFFPSASNPQIPQAIEIFFWEEFVYLFWYHYWTRIGGSTKVFPQGSIYDKLMFNAQGGLCRWRLCGRHIEWGAATRGRSSPGSWDTRGLGGFVHLKWPVSSWWERNLCSPWLRVLNCIATYLGNGDDVHVQALPFQGLWHYGHGTPSFSIIMVTDKTFGTDHD